MVIIMEPLIFVNLNRPVITCDLAIYSLRSANAYWMRLRSIGLHGRIVSASAEPKPRARDHFRLLPDSPLNPAAGSLASIALQDIYDTLNSFHLIIMC